MSLKSFRFCNTHILGMTIFIISIIVVIKSKNVYTVWFHLDIRMAVNVVWRLSACGCHLYSGKIVLSNARLFGFNVSSHDFNGAIALCHTMDKTQRKTEIALRRSNFMAFPFVLSFDSANAIAIGISIITVKAEITTSLKLLTVVCVCVSVSVS